MKKICGTCQDAADTRRRCRLCGRLVCPRCFYLWHHGWDGGACLVGGARMLLTFEDTPYGPLVTALRQPHGIRETPATEAAERALAAAVWPDARDLDPTEPDRDPLTVN